MLKPQVCIFSEKSYGQFSNVIGGWTVLYSLQ